MSADQQTAVFLGDKVLAKAMTSDLEKVEGNWYFKQSALIDRSRFTESDTHTTCGWKGTANYFNYEGEDGKVLKDIAWFYPTPKEKAVSLENKVAFYVGKHGLRVGAPPI